MWEVFTYGIYSTKLGHNVNIGILDQCLSHLRLPSLSYYSSVYNNNDPDNQLGNIWPLILTLLFFFLGFSWCIGISTIIEWTKMQKSLYKYPEESPRIGSVVKGTFCQARLPAFNAEEPHYGWRKPTLQSCPLTSIHAVALVNFPQI